MKNVRIGGDSGGAPAGGLCLAGGQVTTPNTNVPLSKTHPYPPVLGQCCWRRLEAVAVQEAPLQGGLATLAAR